MSLQVPIDASFAGVDKTKRGKRVLMNQGDKVYSGIGTALRRVPLCECPGKYFLAQRQFFLLRSFRHVRDL